MKRPMRTSLLAWTMALAAANLQAQDREWWFDVEVLIYKQDQALERLDELFPQPVPVPDTKRSRDLISAYLSPDIQVLRATLPVCGEKPALPEFKLVLPTEETADSAAITTPASGPEVAPYQSLEQQPTAVIAPQAGRAAFVARDWRVLMQGACQYDFEKALLADLLSPPPTPENFIARVPTVLDGKLVEYPQGAHLLPKAAFNLQELARDIHRQRGIQPLLHLAWRQEVLFGKSKAQRFRLIAGTNYAKAYDVAGYPLRDAEQSEETLTEQPQPADLFSRIDQALAEPLVLKVDQMRSQEMVQTVDELWELDGNFKVYLQYINRVPYLHVDTDLVYRKEGPPGLMETQPARMAAEANPIAGATLAPQFQLYGLPFDQLRRIISNQIHYFDHPMFGMVVQLRRYYRPDPPAQETGQ